MENEQKPMPEGWRISEPYTEGRETARIQAIAAEMRRARPFEPRPVPTHFNGKLIADLTTAERAEFIISMQAPSTQRTLRRDPKDDAQYIFDKKNKPIDPSAQVRNPDGSVNTGERMVSINETLLFEANRRAPKNSLEQDTKGSVDKEKRNRGIWAFTYSKPYNPSDAELERLKKIEAVKPEGSTVANAPAKEEFGKYKKGRLERFRLWFDEKFGDWLYR